MLGIVEILADQARRNGDGQVGNRALQLGDGGLLLRFDGVVRLLDHRGGLGLRLIGDVGLHGLARLLRVCDDLGGLGFGILQLAFVFLKHALAFDASLLGLLKGILDGHLALLQHGLELRPTELGQNDPEQDEDHEHGDELRHVGQDGAQAAR